MPRKLIKITKGVKDIKYNFNKILGNKKLSDLGGRILLI